MVDRELTARISSDFDRTLLFQAVLRIIIWLMDLEMQGRVMEKFSKEYIGQTGKIAPSKPLPDFCFAMRAITEITVGCIETGL